ncbi:MAG TPA: DUF805 domain-containing protein [Cellvibrio sp.]|nr:DUF805 domain-containing protein [Cellvibrio sp.]
MSTNPYQTPEGQLTTDDQAVGEIKFFSPSSRINRLRYWAHGALFAIAFYALIAVGAALMTLVSPFVGVPILVVAYIGLIVFSVIVMIQRLHDLNKTGWMSLLAFVPIANIYLIVLLIFFKGTPGRNNYGLQTPPNKTWHWVVALGFPILALIAIFAVALPAYNQYLDAAQSEYDEAQFDAYPTDDSATDETTTDETTTDETIYTDEAVEDGVVQDSVEEGIIEDDVVEEQDVETSEAETPDATESEAVEAPQSDTPQ